MIAEPTSTTPDPLLASIARETQDLIRTAEAVRQAAASEDLSTLARAARLSSWTRSTAGWTRCLTS